MSDQRLLQLARLADEAAEFESSGFAAPIASAGRVHASRRIGVIARVGPFLALAASVVVVAGLWSRWAGRSNEGTGEPPAGPIGLATLGPDQRELIEFASRLFSSEMRFESPAPRHPLAHGAAPGDESLVVAIVQDPSGGVQCVSWSHESAATAAGVAPAELARQVCRADCVDGPHWLVAAKVTGPRQALPAGEAEVRALAQCILDQKYDRCDSGPSTLSPAGAACMPDGLNVTVERRSRAGR
ncbi:MAG: hypothetical protein AB7K52_08755 [Phycisphaerales bacterium]